MGCSHCFPPVKQQQLEEIDCLVHHQPQKNTTHPSADNEVDVDHLCRLRGRATLDDSYETPPRKQAGANFNDSITTRTPTESPEYAAHMVSLTARGNPPLFPSSSYIRRTADNVSGKDAATINADLGPAISIVNAGTAGTDTPSGVSKTAEEIRLQHMDHTLTDAGTQRC